MDISGILEAEDKLFNENRAEEVEGLLMGAISVALDEQDGMALLSLLNELIGYYRESSRFEDSYKVAEEIKQVANQILPVMSIPYATSMLNIATAYRTGGRLEDALEVYKQVEEIYHQVLEPNDMLMASLYNNESLLFQELRDFENSKKMLEAAVSIAQKNGKLYEEAVSRANIAGTCMQLNELEEGFEHATRAIDLFTELGVADGHYAAALSALGSYYYIKGEFESGAMVFQKAMSAMEAALGKNAYYDRLRDNYLSCMEMITKEAVDITSDNSDSKEDNHKKAENAEITGIALAKAYYEEYGKAMIMERFADYVNKIAVGLAGQGSDCYGWDDKYSRDHDWGPEFCMWVSDETYEAIGEKLQAAYDELPKEFGGYKRAATVQGAGRRGVIRISDFCLRFLGCKNESGVNIRESIDWTSILDTQLSAFTNGEVWSDPEGILTSLRNEIVKGYPEEIQYKKLAESCARFSQTGQYNLIRCIKRGDYVTANLMRSEAILNAMKLAYYIENIYPPHEKWLYKGLDKLSAGAVVRRVADSIYSDGLSLEESVAALERLGEALAMEMYICDYISDTDPYLDHQTEELLMKSAFSLETDEELTLHIAKTEFKAFDKVKNEGGRASCQNDWPTFGIMRRSQYLTWNRTMLLQYLYDFEREFRLGHNLITEKYGRMMESTAPEEYEKIKDNFPENTAEKKAIIEEICRIQVGWMEEFAKEYPHLAGQARSVHTYDDESYNTSYETYLRGEISTYSDKMLQLYTQFIVSLAKSGKNLARMTMENSCKLYGYGSLEDAERFVAM